MTGSAVKTVLVTGASSGIGAAVAVRSAAAGWNVIAGYGTGKTRINDVVSNIVANGGHAQPLHLPLRDRGAIAGVVEGLVADGSIPDAVVLSASPRLETRSFSKTLADDFRHHFDVAVIGNHCLVSELWKQCFRKRKHGHVVALLTTALGPPPTPHMTSYIVAKSGLRAMLECAYAELGRAGLRISTVSPGFTDTPMLHELSDLLLELARSQSETGRFLDPDDVAAAVVDALEAPPTAGEIVDKPIPVGLSQ